MDPPWKPINWVGGMQKINLYLFLANVWVGGGLVWQRKGGTLLASPAKGTKGGRFPMLCLSDSIRDADPSVQRLLQAVADTPSLTALILATWQVTRVLAVSLGEAVLAERVRRPTAWP